MPKMFWPEAIRWTSYVLNRSPASAIKDKTRKECWSGVKPDVQHFKVFGCLGIAHIPKAK